MSIKKLAEQAGAALYAGTIIVNGKDADDFVRRFAELVAAAERELCAKVCEKHGEAQVDNYAVHSAYDCAAVIRARENNNG